MNSFDRFVAAEAAEARRRLAEVRETERLRLAQDLHDGALQQLVGLHYQLAESRRRANDALGADTQQIDDLRAMLEDIDRELFATIKLLRGIISDLRPPGLKEFGLEAALAGYISELEREGGPALPAIDLDVDQEANHLPERLALCLFRVVQEALRNIVKHADATQVHVTLDIHPTELLLDITDDGRGFEPPERLTQLAQAEQLGLLGIAERVESVGGRLDIRSAPGKGTVVTVQIPLDKQGV
ncbi:MAG: sensor histidine kinase [Chloroflexota bacterium]|nr:sensor histidine kinase [Chloroflexota bacterium]